MNLDFIQMELSYPTMKGRRCQMDHHRKSRKKKKK